MAFGWLKKAVTAPVKLAGKVVKVAAPVVKIAKPILEPIYESVVPAPIRKAAKTVSKFAPVAKLVNSLTNKRKGLNMSELETKLRAALEAALKLQGKTGLDLAFTVGALIAALFELARYSQQIGLSMLATEGRVTADNLLGEEPNALIGPNGQLVKFDIPGLPDEIIYDLVSKPVFDYLDKLAAEADAGPNVTAPGTDG